MNDEKELIKIDIDAEINNLDINSLDLEKNFEDLKNVLDKYNKKKITVTTENINDIEITNVKINDKYVKKTKHELTKNYLGNI